MTGGRSNLGYLSQLKRIESADATYQPADFPLVYDRAQDSLVWDVDGHEYIDFCCGFGALALGHNPASVREALLPEHGLWHGMGDVYPSRDKVELLEFLLTLLPPEIDTGLLAVTGAQAVEAALKTAFLSTGKTGVIVFEGGYHGLDFGTLPLNSRRDFWEPFQAVSPTNHVERLPWQCDEAAWSKALANLKARGHEAACVLIEPIQGRGGGYAAGLDWLNQIRIWSQESRVLLIYDEVLVGLGRTGRISFAEQVLPDLICFGKILGGGLPLSACVGTADAMRGWPQSKGEAIHTGTFFGHPMACRAGLATLQALFADGVIESARHSGRVMHRYLAENLPATCKVRGECMMAVIDLKQDGAGAHLMDRLRSQGIIALASGAGGSCLSLTPALNISPALLLRGLDLICRSVRSFGTC